jgi:hypothetical protein
MPQYNLTLISQSNNTVDFMQNINTVLVDGWLGIIILGVLYSILYIAFIFATGQPVKSFTGASFICFGISLMLLIMGLVPVLAVWVMLVASALSIAFWNVD